MEPKQAAALGEFIRARRLELGLSARELARRAGVADVIRLEQGALLNPRAGSLAAIAQALDLEAADLLAVAEMAQPSRELQLSRPYLRAKHHDLPPEALDELEAFVTRLRRKHGLTGPHGREDEH